MLGSGLKARVDRSLGARLTALADGVIADYRREEPTMAAAEWKQAQQALRWATELSPAQPSPAIEACDLRRPRDPARGPRAALRQRARARIAAPSRSSETAADLDRASFDPYLGISRVAVYGLGDVDQAATAIQEAEKRGYVSGRREKRAARRRISAARECQPDARARRSSGDQRRRQLEKARADYQGCIDAFDPIVGFGYAAKNIEICKDAAGSHQRGAGGRRRRSEGL